MCRDRLAADREGGWIEGKQKMKIASLYALETITDEIDECNRVILRKEEGIARKEVAASLFNDAFN